MPSYTRGKLRDVITYVECTSNDLVFYGFKTKDLTQLGGITQADLTALGHQTPTAIAAIQGAITFFNANSPKPARFKKVLNANPGAGVQGSVSTFGDGTDAVAIAAANAKGWSLIKPIRPVRIRNDARATTVAVKVAGSTGFYIQTVPTEDLVNGAATALGLILPGSLSNTERDKCFRGVSGMKPLKVVKNKITLPCSYDAVGTAADAGWSLVA